MKIDEIIAQMQKYGLNQNNLCNDLAFNKGDLSAYLSGKKPLPNSRSKALYWYFKCKEIELSQETK